MAAWTPALSTSTGKTWDKEELWELLHQKMGLLAFLEWASCSVQARCRLWLESCHVARDEEAQAAALTSLEMQNWVCRVQRFWKLGH